MKQPSRVLPHNLDAEASVLGGIFLRNEVLTLLSALEVEHFYGPKHQAVFMAMRNLEYKATPIDPVTVENELLRLNKLDAVGGLAFLGELALRVPSIDNVIHYAEIVMGHHDTRCAAVVAGDLLDACYVAIEPEERIELVEQAISKLTNLKSRRADTARTVGDLMLAELRTITKDLDAIERGEKIVMGMPSGITRIDHRLGGHPIGQVTVFMGGPGHGKSTYLGQSAAAVSSMDDMAMIYSFEDAAEYWAQRGLAQESGVSTEDIAARRFNGDRATITALFSAANRAKHRKEFVQMASGWTVDDVIADVCARRRRIQSQLGGRKRRCAVYIDYIQVMRFVFGKNGIDKRHDAIKYAMDRLQWLAQGCGSDDPEDRYAVIAASQVKPEVAKERRAPTKDDWVDGSAIVTVPKLVLGLNRPNTYDPDIDPTTGEVRVLKRNQGDPDLKVSVVIDLRIHTMRDATDPTPQYPRLA